MFTPASFISLEDYYVRAGLEPPIVSWPKTSPSCLYFFSSFFSLSFSSFFSVSFFFSSLSAPPPQPATVTDRATRNVPINSVKRLALLNPSSFVGAASSGGLAYHARFPTQIPKAIT